MLPFTGPRTRLVTCRVLDLASTASPIRRHRDVTHASVASRRWRPPRRHRRGRDRHEHAIAARARRHRNIHAGYLGANVCAQNDDRDGSNRCKKILEAANDLEVSRVLLDKALKALGENPSTDQIRSALGMENIAVSSRPAPWWDARHDLCLLKGVLEHGPLASEKVREAILEDEALRWPSDMPQAPPKPPAIGPVAAMSRAVLTVVAACVKNAASSHAR